VFTMAGLCHPLAYILLRHYIPRIETSK
jgi:hypothetical protein